jgi:hypothetical protein
MRFVRGQFLGGTSLAGLVPESLCVTPVLLILPSRAFQVLFRNFALRCPAAIDEKDLASHVTGGIGRQEDGWADHFVGFRRAAKGNHASPVLIVVGIVPEIAVHFVDQFKGIYSDLRASSTASCSQRVSCLAGGVGDKLLNRALLKYDDASAALS